MVTCTGNMQIGCQNCGHVNTIDSDDLDFELVESEEREMGSENTWEAQVEITCDKCGADIEVTHSVYEYPSGTKNSEEVTAKNGIVVSQCQTSIEP
jgi:uncharacterized Zn finger protein